MLTSLVFWVLTAIAAGILLGAYWPEMAVKMEVLSSVFISIIKVFIPPIIFFTIVLGISHMGDLKQVGRIGLKALIYFEIVSTIALAIGLFLAHWLQPGKFPKKMAAEMNALIAANAEDTVKYQQKAEAGMSLWEFFKDNLVLQVLIAAIIIGIAINLWKKKEKVIAPLEKGSHYLFLALKYVMYLAPLAAFGGIAFAIGKFGLQTLIPLGKLVGSVYLTMLVFIFGILGSVLWYYRLKIWDVIRYIKEELLIVWGTSSSEPAMPSLMEKLQKMGCSKSVVGLVVPTGYSFNLDGTSIYLSMAVIFLFQFYNVDVSFGKMASIIFLLMITSKGAAAVTGAGFIILASTLSSMDPQLIPGLGLLFGVDKFMSEARALTNIIGNSVATIVISKSEKEYIDPKPDKKHPEIPHTVV